MPNIIVVDDDVTNIQLLQMLLEIEGYQVLTSTNVETALSQISSSTDALIIDWYLERHSSGLELLQAIRSGRTAAGPEAYIVMTSGDNRKKIPALDAGANKFLLKPYSPDELVQSLRDYLSTGDSE